MGATRLATVSSYSSCSNDRTSGVFTAIDSSEVKPVDARVLDSEPILTVLELNISVG